MDPYLESPALWPDVHHEVISEVRAFLTKRLRPRYFVRVELRVYVSDDDDTGRRALVPDLRIGDAGEDKGSLPLTAPASAVATIEPITMTKLLDEEIHEAFLEIEDLDLHRVVTVLEVVSPTNKIAGSQGRASYLGKRYRVLGSDCHWVEIDLLRSGSPLIPRRYRSLADYCVHISRTEQRPESKAWPLRLEQRLPVVPIPLKPGDTDVSLDLQEILESVYDRAGYDITIDYRKPPAVPLTPSQEAWADALLKAKGLR